MLLNVLFLIIAALSAVGLCAFVPAISFWWLVPLFIGGYVGAFLLYMFFLSVCALCMPKRKKIHSPKAFCAFFIRITMDWLMRVFRIRVNLTGTDLLPNEPCVLVSNHRSDFDPMAVLGVLRGRKLAYISKEANFKIPVVGNFIHHAGFLAIDRGNGMRALRTLKQAAEMMQNCKMDIGIYPEGTRSKTGELLRFKAGAFILAKKADAPIVVMVTKGTENISKNVPFRATNVELNILSVIDRETVQNLTQEELRDRVQEIVENALKA